LIHVKTVGEFLFSRQRIATVVDPAQRNQSADVLPNAIFLQLSGVMMTRFLIGIFLWLFATGAMAQDDSVSISFGGDSFLAGPEATLTTTGTDDLFMAGETVRAVADISGSAHAAGRRVSLQAGIGQDAYAAGMDVEVLGQVGGDASLAGYDIIVDGSIGGDLRASGAKLSVNGPVAGYAAIAGENVYLNSVITGDARVAAKELVFGPEARIDGKLTVYERVGEELQIPESVVSEDRLERVPVEDWEKGDWNVPPVFNWWRAVWTFIGCVIVVAAIAALIAAVAPEQLALMRTKTLEAPFRSLWLGFLMESALLGSSIVFAMTVIGIFLVPAMIVLALIVGFFGYVVGAYSFGVGLLLAIGRSEPDSLGDRALAAGVGSLLTGLIVLIPFLGWLFMIALTLAGIGAITVRVFRPTFFTAA
jgi:hypothetical protein